jgi:hypothetical protein
VPEVFAAQSDCSPIIMTLLVPSVMSVMRVFELMYSTPFQATGP